MSLTTAANRLLKKDTAMEKVTWSVIGCPRGHVEANIVTQLSSGESHRRVLYKYDKETDAFIFVKRLLG